MVIELYWFRVLEAGTSMPNRPQLAGAFCCVTNGEGNERAMYWTFVYFYGILNVLTDT
jgi:hypothetical protein